MNFALSERVPLVVYLRHATCSQGTGSAYGKSSRLTTVDRGAGYDASDSFIDDAEAVSVDAIFHSLKNIKFEKKILRDICDFLVIIRLRFTF